MVPPDASAEELLSAFNSISFTQQPGRKDGVAKDTIEIDAFEPPGERFGKGEFFENFSSSDSACIAEAFTKRDGEAEVLVESDEFKKPDHPLIVYTSSRRSAHKLEQNIGPQKPMRNFVRRDGKYPAVNLSSLKISRRRRSLPSSRARSTVWGFLGNVLPDSMVDGVVDLNLSSDGKSRRSRGGPGIRKALGNHTSKKLRGKACPHTGRISLKIKIGNCDLDNFTNNFNASARIVDGEVHRVMALPSSRNMGDVLPSDASVPSTKMDINDTIANPCFRASTCQEVVSQEMVHMINNRSSDPGTSPDSEVINSIGDDPLFGKAFPNGQEIPVLANSCASVEGVPRLKLQKNKFTKGKKQPKIHQVGKCSTEINTTNVENLNNAEVSATLGRGQKVSNISCDEALTVEVAKPHSSEINISAGLVSSDSCNQQSCELLIPCTNGKKLPKCTKANRSKSKSKILNTLGKGDKVSKKKGNQNKPGCKPEFSEAGDTFCSHGVESHMAEGNAISADYKETGRGCKGSTGPINGIHFSLAGVKEQCVPIRNAWVLCDDCEKWRRIPATLADQIEETNCGWTCKDNTDKDFADCSVPQEKSNAEINDELEISDASCEDDSCDVSLKYILSQPKVLQQSSWSLIKSNLFLHRSRKTQTIDEVMVCHCKPPSDGRMACGVKCLNRMLNIECVKGTCPCGELCSNQQFQRRKYAKLKWFRCGKKGHGLQALDDITEGQFLIEYVGEVLDVHKYEARQREYALNGHKHFYFMTLNGSEVIDACAKGNLGRFINHSCDPNCRTEKWMVNGEVCVGLFAVKDIKKGEEVTFDYNYVRVFGAAAKKCVCGSQNCRGYIGGDLSNSEVIVQGESDDESSEPLMTCEDREMKDDWNDIMSNSTNVIADEIASESPVNGQGLNKHKFVDVSLESKADTHSSATVVLKIKGSTSSECLENSVSTVVQNKMNVDNSAVIDSALDAVGTLNEDKETEETLNTFATCACEVEANGILSEMQRSVMNISVQSDDCVKREMDSRQVEHSFMQKRLENFSGSAHGSEITISRRNPPVDVVKSKSKLKYACVGTEKEPASFYPRTKTSHLSISIKKGKVKSSVATKKATPDEDRPHVASHRSDFPEVDKLRVASHTSDLPELFLNSHFEAVEEKLNELLDLEGGISKRKDASRGYLKLLFLTAASGSNGHGEAIQSNRDLSMILDALLKTKSRTVLVDIINKNGLQMLHNIMKRCGREFIKTPILRKLLKILEYLATREILKLEHITGGPPRPGVESFKDSILALTEHIDKQVHQSARTFRDKWIPRSLRKSCCIEGNDVRMELPQPSNFGRLPSTQDQGGKPSEAMPICDVHLVPPDTVKISSVEPNPVLVSTEPDGTIKRKRKSRWDNPAEDHLQPSIRSNLEGDRKLIMDEDIPPGFSSQCNGHTVPWHTHSAVNIDQEKGVCIRDPFDIVVGSSQMRFIASVSVSYGIPSSIMQQFGIPAETCGGWTVAPGIPFHPFPPLPCYARNNGDPPPSTSLTETKQSAAEDSEKLFLNAYHSGQKHARTPDMDPTPCMNFLGADGRSGFQRDNSYNIGRKYFRQQKWNDSKVVPPPPWFRTRNG